MTQRAWGWETRLRELIEAKRNLPFAWGSNDCLRFVIEDYAAMMGTAPPNVPSWDSMLSAARVLKQKPLDEWLTTLFGPPVYGWSHARRGDVVTVPGGGIVEGVPPETACSAVVTGPSIAVIGDPSKVAGLAFLPLDRALMTWRIGD